VTNDESQNLILSVCKLARDYASHKDLNVGKLAMIVLALFEADTDGPETFELIRAIMRHGSGDA
jgi:hypothetical protein